MKTQAEIENYLRNEALPGSWRVEFIRKIENPSDFCETGSGLGMSLSDWIKKHYPGNIFSLISDPLISWGEGEERDKWAVFSQRFIDWLKGLPDTAKWVYRLESTKPNSGLWYDSQGKWCWDKNGIGCLPNCKTKDLPMDYDERYKKAGRDWFSSCSQKEDLLHWYSKEDALELISQGFVFTRYLATEYYEYPLETTFIKHTCLKREVIDFSELWEQ